MRVDIYVYIEFVSACSCCGSCETVTCVEIYMCMLSLSLRVCVVGAATLRDACRYICVDIHMCKSSLSVHVCVVEAAKL